MKEKQFHGNYWQGKTRKQITDSTRFFLIAILVIVVIISTIGIINVL